MKILYICSVNKTHPLETGVYKKVVAQCKVMTDAGNEVFFACREGMNHMIIENSRQETISMLDFSKYSKRKRDKYIVSFIYDFSLHNNINCLYSRYGSFSYDTHKLYTKLKKNGVKVLLEIPTYPLTQRWSNISQSLKSHQYSLIIKLLYNYSIGSLGIPFFRYSVDRIVNNNGFKKIWGVPVIPITNGIDVKTIPDSHRRFNHTDEIRIMSVANVANWHGFDRLIRGLAEYYKNPHDTIVRFQLAGPGMEVDLLRKLTKELHVEKYVDFLGTVIGEQLNELFLHSHIGVSVLGVHRAKMKECDSLKAREFCARRLPFLTEEAETQYRGKPFVLYVPSNETPVDICKVVSFYNTIVVHPEILDEMRSFAEAKCDWTYAFRNVISYLEKV